MRQPSNTDLKLITASQWDHSDCDCFGCAILSHGDEGVVHGKDGKIKLQSLIEPFNYENCETLHGKPKIFIIQVTLH